MMNGVFSLLRRFRAEQDGNSTIEFVVFFPALMSLFLMGFEAGYYMVRSVMLERSVDISVRDVRLSSNDLPDFDAFKQSICEKTLLVSDCQNSLLVEMQQVDAVPGAVASVGQVTRCVDKESDDDPLSYTTYDIGAENQIMLVRVCALVKPFFPTSRLGAGMVRDNSGNQAIVAKAAFVTEPGLRAIKVTQSGNGSGNSNGGIQ